MSLTSPSSKCRRTIVWRSSSGSGGMVASVQKKRTTVPKVYLRLILICLFFCPTSLCLWPDTYTNPFLCHLLPLCFSPPPLHVLSSPGLGMENIGGIFVVLVCGLLVAIFMAVLEFVWMLRQAPGNEVREGYLTCICFVSLSPPWHPHPQGAVRLYSNQFWHNIKQGFISSSGLNVTLFIQPARH